MKPRIEAYHNLVLEEDGDTGRGPGKSNNRSDAEGVKCPGILLLLSLFAGPLPHRKILETGQTNNVFINIHIGMIIQQES